ncbi:hypothetical protein ACFFLM_22840 [Deinococcus oregonensis]|uniref:Uncharacterized protein n=1 Tax=Deinococcus oregonensis TaxID=1805970 RepID=A0ABV6B517_9DEIO
MTTSVLSVQDLKARGWSPTMIRTLLGAHDQERTTNRLGRGMDKPARLYQEARVMELEATEAFMQARERAEAHRAAMVKANQTRQAWQAEMVARYEALPLPQVQVRPLAGGVRPSTDPTVWQFHVQRFARWQTQHESVMSSVPAAARRAAHQRMLQRYRGEVDQAYGWVECREPQYLSASMGDTG